MGVGSFFVNEPNANLKAPLALNTNWIKVDWEVWAENILKIVLADLEKIDILLKKYSNI